MLAGQFNMLPMLSLSLHGIRSVNASSIMDGLLCSSFPFVPGYSLDASGHLGESGRRSYHHWLMLEILISVQQKSAQDRKMTSIYSVFERKYFDVKHF